MLTPHFVGALYSLTCAFCHISCARTKRLTKPKSIVNVVVQFYLCFKLIIIHYHIPEQRKILN